MDTTVLDRRRDRLRVFIDRPATTGAATEWHELTHSDREAVRVTASDLRHAQSIRASAREEARRCGKDPDSISLVVDVPVLISTDAASARRALDAIPATEVSFRSGDQLRYVGTGRGLRGLLGDIFAAGVADGVTITPLGGYNDLEFLVACVLDRESADIPHVTNR